MQDKTKKLYEELSERKAGLVELSNEEKAELLELLNDANYGKMLKLSNYNVYTKVMTIAKEIEEIDIKLRTLKFLLKD